MTDKPVINGSKNEPPQPKTVIQIMLMADGQIIINGPIEDKIVFMGLLEIAKERVFVHHRSGGGGPHNIIPIRRVP